MTVLLRRSLAHSLLLVALVATAPAALSQGDPSEPYPDACVEGETLEAGSRGQSNAFFASFDPGQSFEAPCTGTLEVVAPSLFSGDASFSGVLRIYDGEGFTGSELATVPFSGTEPAAVGYVDMPMTEHVVVESGRTYSFFLDITSGGFSLGHDSGDAYPGGTMYSGNNGPGSASEYFGGGWDMAFRLTFAPRHPVRASDGFFDGSLYQGDEEHVKVEWDRTVEPGVLYQIERREVGSTDAFELLAVRSAQDTEYLDTSAAFGVSYEYCVEAVGSTVRPEPACDVGGRVLRRPRVLGASDSTLTDGTVLEWIDRSKVEVGYVVYRDLAGGTGPFTPYDTTAANTTSYFDEAATPLQEYRYCVGILHTTGGVETAAEPIACDTGTRGAVLPPTGVTASNGTFSDRVRVVWSGPSDSLYAVYRRAVSEDGDPVGTRETVASAVAGLSYDDMTAEPDEPYRYCVTTLDGGDPGDPDDDTESVGACAPDPGRLGGLASPTAVAASQETFDNRVEVTWEDPGPDETGLRVYRALVGGERQLVESLRADRTLYVDNDAAPGVTYEYCVAAIAEAVVDEVTRTNESDPVCAEGTRARLLAPTGFAASDDVEAHEAYVELSWASTSSVVQLFRVRRTDADETNAVVLATLPPTARSYQDRTAHAGTVYRYQVEAVAVVGAEAMTVSQGLAPVFARAEAERVAVTRLYTEAETPAEVARAEDRAAAVEAELVQGVTDVLTGLDLDASALVAGAVAGDLVDAASGWDAGSRALKAPGRFTASRDREGGVTLTWDDRSDVNRLYELTIRDVDADRTRTVWLGGNDNDYNDTEAVPSSETEYALRAVDVGGVDTDGTDLGPVLSASEAAGADGFRRLTPPTDVRVTRGAFEDRAVVTWQGESEERPRYAVRWEIGGAAYADTVGVGEGWSYTIPVSESEVGQTITASVRAVDRHSVDNTYVDADGDADYVEATGWATLLKPRVFTASTGYTDRVVLTWTDDSGLNSGYRITGPGGYTAEEPGDATTHTRMETEAGGTYTIVPISTVTYDNVPDEARATGALLTSGTRETPTSEPRLGEVGGLSLSPGARFGFTVDAEEGIAVAGAPGDTQESRSVPEWARPYDPAFYRTRGIDAATDPDERPNVGAVAFYDLRAEGGPEAALADLAGPDGDLSYNSGIGYHVDIHGDWAIVGAPGGVTLVSHPEPYDVDNTGYREFHQHEIDYNDGAAYLFRRNFAGEWVRQGMLRAVEGGYIDVADLECIGAGCPINLRTNGTGDLAALVFEQANEPTELRQRTFQERSGAVYEQVSRAATLTPEVIHRQFGWTVALSDDWAFIRSQRISATADDYVVYVYQRSGTEWVAREDPVLVSAPRGESIGYYMAASDDVLAVSHGNLILTYVLGGTEVVAGPVIDVPSIATLSRSLDVEGDLLAVGQTTFNGGRVLLYRRNGEAWQSDGQLSVPVTVARGSVARFGEDVSIEGGFVSVSAVLTSGVNEVYSYAYVDGAWTHAGTVTAPVISGTSTEGFGRSIAVTGDRLVAGAPKGGNATDPNDNAGAVFFGTLSIPPGDVRASDSRYADRVVVRWDDRSDSETGFEVYRRGPDDAEHELLADVGANTESYDDASADPGTAYSYCVASVVETGEGVTNVSTRACDVGLRPANGAISGRIATGGGGFVDGVPVCLSPDDGEDPSLAPTQALMFDGEAGHARVDGFGTMPGAFTLEAWVNADAFESPDFITTVAGVENGDGAALLRFVSGTGGYVPQFTVKSQGSPEAVRLTWPEALAPGWHHLVGVYAEGSVALYVDGVKMADAHGQGLLVAGGVFRIGQSVRQRFFDGRIDEVRVWDRALTADEVAARKDHRLGGDEDGLYAYWPMQQGAGRVLADHSPHGRHAALVGGAEWTPEASPAGACATTDADGNYTFDNIRYGAGAQFTVAPTSPTRQFSPATQTVSLRTEAPTENQLDFNDTSAFTVSGRVVHAVDQTQWPGQEPLAAPNVSIYVRKTDADGTDAQGEAFVAGTTATDGSFALAVTGVGNYDIWAQAEVTEAGPEGETEVRVLPLDFAAAYEGEPLDDGALTTADGVVNVDLQGDVDGLSFTNTADFALRGRAAGGCGRTIGSVTFRVYTPDKRFDRTFTTSGAEEYALPLPPLPFRLEYRGIDGVPETLDRADVVDYFRNLATLRADLTDAEADTVDFRYRAPITLVVEGLDAPSASCSTGYTVTRTIDEQKVELQTIPNVPIIGEYDRVPLTIRAYEDYGAGGLCPINAATVRIFDGFADAQSDSTVTLSSGEARYTTVGRSPDTFSGRTIGGVDRSYQKSLTAVLEVEDGPSVTETIWAVVEGSRERPATFTSATTDEHLLHILRDPPGSQSYAYLDEGHTACQTWSNINLSSFRAGLFGDVAIGFKSSAGTPFLEVENGAGLLIEGAALLGGGVEQTTDGDGSRPGDTDDAPGRDNLRICATTTERWETPDGWIAEDLFAGVALNVIFAEDDRVAVQGCEVQLSDGLAMDLNETDPFETSFVYGRSHITGSVIPTLERLARLQGNHTVEGEIDDESVEFELERSAQAWRDILAKGDALADEAMAGEVTNRSFSAGAQYERSAGTERVTTDTRTEIVHFTVDARVGWIITTAGYDRAIGAQLEQVTESRIGTDQDTTNTDVFGYVLYDDDGGDYFSVNVGRDPVYGSFVFETVAGASSNPWEPGTQRRDAPRIATTTPVIDEVLEGEAAVLTLSLTNASESNERREYIVDVPPHLNPDGAAVTVNGYELREKRYLVEPNQTISIPVTVARGPEADTTRIGFVAYAEFEHDYWRTAPQFEMGEGTADTTWLEVRFAPLVRPVRLVEPLDGWAITGSAPTLTLTLGDIDLGATTEEALAREEIGVEVRQPRGAWTRIDTVTTTGDALIMDGDPTRLRPSVVVDWDAADLPDGPYELRAYARRTGQTVAPWFYGPAVPGTIDRTPPVPFGPPEPADVVLALGETVGITFEEPIDCAAFRQGILGGSAAAELVDQGGQGIVASVGCAERTVLLAPADPAIWSVIEGQLVTARLRGVTDLAGNPMAPLAGTEAGWDAAWRFTVRRNAFGWTPSLVDVVAQPSTPTDLPAALVNGRAQPVDFALVPHHETGLPFSFARLSESGEPTAETVRVTTSALEGTVASGNVQPLAFRWPGATEGTYQATIEVESWEAGQPLGATPLVVTVDVACQAPPWAVNAAAFEYQMTIVSEVSMASGGTSSDPADLLGAFVDGELRGVAAVGNGGGDSPSLTYLTVYGTGAPERITFQAWDNSACALHRTTSSVVEFAADGLLGSPSTPFGIGAPGEGGAPLAVPLAAGWNAISTNREGTTELSAALVGVGRGEDDLIRSQTASAQYVPGTGWVGDLVGMEPEQGYKIKVALATEMVHPGISLDPTAEIPLASGWNWIGYLPNRTLPINEALASGTFATDDQIKAHGVGAATYVEGAGWFGDLTIMEPGVGYQLEVRDGGTLTYPAEPVARQAASASLRARPARRMDTLPVTDDAAARSIARPVALDEAPPTEDRPEAVTASPTASRVRTVEAARLFEHSMAVTATVDAPPARTFLAAYAVTEDGEELRGVARIDTVDALGGTRAFLLAYGAEGDVLVLRAATETADGVLTPSETVVGLSADVAAPDGTLPFAIDAVVGTAANPVAARLSGETSTGEDLPEEVALAPTRPNPFSDRATFTFALPAPTHVRLVLYDVLGREVAVLADGERPAGVHAVSFDGRALASGSYVARLVAGLEVRVRTFTVAR